MPPLPYDATPPPSPPSTESMTIDPPAPEEVPSIDILDRTLDEYRPAIPDHVQALVGRMSKGKVYLLENSPAIIHTGDQQRTRGDPRIAALAEQLNEHDPTEWLNVVSAAAPSRIRHNALYIRSDLIKHLSTSKMFSWVTSLGTSVMGIEWLNDTTLLLLFPSASASLLALTLLSKAGFDPAEGDDPLLERSAHPIPISLLAHIDIKPVESKAGEELLGVKTEDSPAEGVQRKGRGGFQSGIMADIVDQSSTRTWELEDGVDPKARVTVRFAVEGDVEVRQAAKNSEWYARHGRKAGKEQSASSRRPGPYNRPAYEDEEVGWVGEGWEGRDLGRRIGRGAGSRRGGRATQTLDDLDRELEGLKSGDSGRRSGGGRGRGGKGERRPKRDKDDLDKELDNMFG